MKTFDEFALEHSPNVRIIHNYIAIEEDLYKQIQQDARNSSLEEAAGLVLKLNTSDRQCLIDAHEAILQLKSKGI